MGPWTTQLTLILTKADSPVIIYALFPRFQITLMNMTNLYAYIYSLVGNLRSYILAYVRNEAKIGNKVPQYHA